MTTSSVAFFLARKDMQAADNARFLTGPITQDGSYSSHVWAFSRGELFTHENADLKFTERHSGTPQDFSVTTYGAVLVTQDVSRAIREHEFDVQLIPCTIVGGSPMVIFNPSYRVDCIDRGRSVLDCNRDGSIKMVLDLWLSTAGIEHEIFRLQDWETAGFVVSQRFCDWYRDNGLTGLDITQINGSAD